MDPRRHWECGGSLLYRKFRLKARNSNSNPQSNKRKLFTEWSLFANFDADHQSFQLHPIWQSLPDDAEASCCFETVAKGLWIEEGVRVKVPCIVEDDAVKGGSRTREDNPFERRIVLAGKWAEKPIVWSMSYLTFLGSLRRLIRPLVRHHFLFRCDEHLAIYWQDRDKVFHEESASYKVSWNVSLFHHTSFLGDTGSSRRGVRLAASTGITTSSTILACLIGRGSSPSDSWMVDWYSEGVPSDSLSTVSTSSWFDSWFWSLEWVIVIDFRTWQSITWW